MTSAFLGSLDQWTAVVGSQLWTALQNGTGVVLVTALLLWAFKRRVPAGVQAALWTFALLKFLVPSGPSLVGSLSRGLQVAGAPLSIDARTALAASEHPALLALKLTAVTLYAVLLVALAARAAMRFRGHTRRGRALPPAPPATRALVAACARRLGLRRAPDVRVTAEPVSPHIAGIARPLLVLPRWLADRRDAQEAFVLHELAHLRRRDHWLLPLIAAVEIAFFFWPFVRFAAKRLRSAREAACDAAAVSHGPLCAAAYARSLVGAARCLGASPAGALAPAGVTSRLEARLDFLLAPARPRRRSLLAVLLAAWGVWVLAGGARAQPQPCPCPASCVER